LKFASFLNVEDYVMPKFKDTKKKKKKEEAPAKISKKPGPRDVGKNSDYKMPKFRDNKRRNSSSGRKSVTIMFSK